MTKLIDGIPVLQGEIVGKQVKIWCEFCRRFHYHGWPDKTENISHRVAHCIKEDSPYQETGYFVEVNEGD